MLALNLVGRLVSLTYQIRPLSMHHVALHQKMTISLLCRALLKPPASFLHSRVLSTGAATLPGRTQDKLNILDKLYDQDGMTNVTPTILSHVGRNLHQVPQHPLCIIKERITHHFHSRFVNRVGNPLYAHFDDVSPVVSTEQNFDSLLVPPNHVARSKKDNYYVNEERLLRAHTSAHQRDFIKMGLDRFLVSGDVYRRDAIDSSHYPVFHQMEGVRLYTGDELFQDEKLGLKLFDSEFQETVEKQGVHTIDAVKMLEITLKDTLNGLMRSLFGNEIETRWNSCYFPFTHPSFEMEIKFQGEWLEVLGSGIMQQSILEKGGANEKVGWAFGLGLDRLAMLLFNIPDIRLFWSKDKRFINQFKSVGLDPSSNIQFEPFSNYPPSYKDLSFWLSESDYSDNDFFDIVRSVSEGLVEEVVLMDTYTHPETKRLSHCYRLTYRAMDRTFTNKEVNEIMKKLRCEVQEKLKVEVR